MCIIAIKPKNKKMFDDETIKTMFKNNPDGAGYMYYDFKTKKVIIKKGYMNVKTLLKSLKENDLTKTNVVLHFRIGTSGFNDKMNCHPYPLYQKNALNCKTDIAMAHNGILSGYIPPKTSDINDTQVFIQNVLNNLKKGFQYDSDKLMLIEELIDTNKLAFLDSKNKITMVGNFIQDGDYIYSNNSYKTKTIASHKTYIPSYYYSVGYNYQSDFWKDDNESGFWKDRDDRHKDDEY